MTMNEDLCSYELSKALKACGFDEPCRCCFVVDKGSESNVDFEEFGSAVNWNRAIVGGYRSSCKHISAPTLWHAQKWLREKLLLNIGANPAIPTRKWQFYIDDLNQQINPHDGELMTRWDDDMQEKADERLYDSYECALSAGIAASLELIKKGE